MQFSNATMKRIRLDRESRPELYCSKCMYRTGGGDCPKHARFTSTEYKALLSNLEHALCTGLGD